MSKIFWFYGNSLYFSTPLPKCWSTPCHPWLIKVEDGEGRFLWNMLEVRVGGSVSGDP